MTKPKIRPPSSGRAKPKSPPPGKAQPVPAAEDFPAPPKEQGQLHKDNLIRSPDGHFHNP